jgi:hypothetical protein
MMHLWASRAVVRAVLFVLVLPLALSSTLPAFARAVEGPAVHVCHCEVKGGHSTCACRICHPERKDLRLSKESIRGQCGDENPVFGASLAIALPPAPAVTIPRAPVTASAVLRLRSLSPDVVLSPPTPPPRLSLV